MRFIAVTAVTVALISLAGCGNSELEELSTRVSDLENAYQSIRTELDQPAPTAAPAEAPTLEPAPAPAATSASTVVDLYCRFCEHTSLSRERFYSSCCCIHTAVLQYRIF